MNEGKKIRSDSWTHIFFACAFFLSLSVNIIKNRIHKKAVAVAQSVSFLPVNLPKKNSTHTKMMMHSVLSTSIYAVRTKIYGVCT